MALALSGADACCVLTGRISVWDGVSACSVCARSCTDPCRTFTRPVRGSLECSWNALAAMCNAVLSHEAARPLCVACGRWARAGWSSRDSETGTVRAHMGVVSWLPACLNRMWRGWGNSSCLGSCKRP